MGAIGMRTSFLSDDVTVLLKDITGLVQPLPSSVREVQIQNGVPYSEMLPLEYIPSAAYLREYGFALENFSVITAQAVQAVAEQIYRRKGKGVVLVSLARAGTPIGVLLKRYLSKQYDIEVPHYTISIIRGLGIDTVAMEYILRRYQGEALQFIDGWTGKGAIGAELRRALAGYPHIDGGLAVLSDPAGIADIRGTQEDFLIASSCLNATVCGLMSRTFYRQDVIGDTDFHGAAFYREWRDGDRTYEFIHKIESAFEAAPGLAHPYEPPATKGIEEVKRIAEKFGVANLHFVKPGIGEATRVLLRRTPQCLLIRSGSDPYVSHLISLAQEKNVAIRQYPLVHYRACGIIQDLSDV